MTRLSRMLIEGFCKCRQRIVNPDNTKKERQRYHCESFRFFPVSRLADFDNIHGMVLS